MTVEVDDIIVFVSLAVRGAHGAVSARLGAPRALGKCAFHDYYYTEQMERGLEIPEEEMLRSRSNWTTNEVSSMILPG